VLDIGCGAGLYLAAMLEAAPYATGIGVDADPDAAALALLANVIYYVPVNSADRPPGAAPNSAASDARGKFNACRPCQSGTWRYDARADGDLAWGGNTRHERTFGASAVRSPGGRACPYPLLSATPGGGRVPKSARPGATT
jgi:SAM-dependent methyltransferase